MGSSSRRGPPDKGLRFAGAGGRRQAQQEPGGRARACSRDVVGRWRPRARAASRLLLEETHRSAGVDGHCVSVQAPGVPAPSAISHFPPTAGGLLPHSVCPSGAVVQSEPVHCTGQPRKISSGLWLPASNLVLILLIVHLKFLILASSGIPGLGLHCSFALEGMEIATRRRLPCVPLLAFPLPGTELGRRVLAVILAVTACTLQKARRHHGQLCL